MANTVTLKTSGLYREPNQLDIPEGSLSEASNVVINRDNVIEPRRGFGLFGTAFGTITDRLSQLFVYKQRLLRQFNDILQFDTGTVDNAGDELFESFSGSFAQAQEGLRTKSIESNGNLYFTSEAGIQKISAATPSDFTTDPGYVTQAGGIKALDLTANAIESQGNITGFLPQDSTVAYRVVWGTNDLNKNLILGVPSQRAEVYFSLSTALIGDYNNFLQRVQDIADTTAPNDSIINDSDYVSSLSLPITATAQELQLNMVALAEKLDQDILIANDTGSGAPLTTSAISIQNNTSDPTTNLATITFSAGDPTNYWIVGSNVFLTGFPNGENTTSINGLQILTNVTSSTISFTTSATGNTKTFFPSNVNTGTDTINITNHGFNNFDPIQFTTTGTLPTPLVAGTTYYVGNVTSTSFQVFTNSSLSTLVALSGPGGTGTHTVTYFMSVTNTSINSGEFENLTQPAAPSNPATDQELVDLQTYLKQFISTLQSFPTTGTPPIVSAYSQTNFASTLTVTTSANVILNITIPQSVTPDYFFQIYRSPTLSATGTTVLSQLTASDELQQVYEAFPTAQDLVNGYVTVTDIVPDEFLGADLYTNQNTGVGIANANEVPPFALDINKYKNTVFYANTRTKYRMPLTLLGVTQIIADYNMSNNPNLVISDGQITNIYYFVLGIQQVVHVQTVADVAGSLAGKYFLLHSANDATTYYIWYNVSGTGTDPMVSGATGIEVFINTNDSANTVASKTNDTINTLITQDFSSTVSTNIIVITNNAEGYATNASAGTSGFIVSTPTPGQGERVTNPVANLSTVADVAHSLAGKYFVVSSTFNQKNYYVWYIVSGIGADPTVPNAIGIPIQISTNDTAATVAAKTATQLNAFSSAFRSSNPSTNTLLVESYASPLVGTSGFTLNSFTPGVLQVLLSNNPSPAIAINDTAQSLVRVINRNDSEVLYAFYLSQSSTVPGEMTLESRNLLTPKYYLLGSSNNVGSSFNPNLSPTLSITSISTGAINQSIVTTSIPHNLNTGNQIVISNTNSTPLTNGLFTISYLSPTTFTINNAFAVTAPSTQGNLVPATQANGGDNEVKINRIYYSDLQQPEAVPLGNTIDVGDQDKAILRIFPLRDSLFVFKEDGLFRISGDVAPFTLQLFDSSVFLIAPDSVAVTKNIIYGWTTQGILGVTEAGVSNPPISRPIDISILPLNNENYPNFSTATWGVGYDSDNSYTVFTVQNPNDTEATIAYRFGTITSTWTNFDKTNTCGIVDVADDKLYLGAGDINFIEQERKSFTRQDYADRELSSVLNPNQYFGNVFKLPSVAQFSAGDVLVQNQEITVYGFNALLQKLDLDPGLNTNSITSIGTGFTPTITTSGNHLLSTGDFVTISNTLTTPLVNGVFQVTVLNPTQFTIVVPSPVITAGTAGLVKYSYYNTLKVSGGVDFESALMTLVNRFNIEPSLIYATQSYSITSNSIANPSVITLAGPHNLGPAGTIRTVNISSNVGSTPSINGNNQVTVIDSTHLSIPINVTVGGTGGTLTTIDDYLTAIDSKSGTIINNTVANPTIVTSINHGFVSDRYIQITGSNSTPVIDGNYNLTVVNNNSFSIPVNVLIAGSSGTYSTLDGTFQDLLVNYNYIINTLNVDPGASFKNYALITSTTDQETIILSVNNTTNEITTALTLDYTVGPLSVFKAIPSSFTYSPVTFKDPLGLKQVSEATLMFENKAFTNATLGFASDLVPNFIPVNFLGNGNGAFGLGTGPFGNNFFGGGANAAPFRTYIPRPTQRCRYIVPQFTHTVALEKYSINGLTLTGSVSQSSRAYR